MSAHLRPLDEGKTCPARLGRGKNALGGWLDQVRLAINALGEPFIWQTVH